MRGDAEDCTQIMAQAEMHLSLLEKELLTQSELRDQENASNRNSMTSATVSPAKSSRAWGAVCCSPQLTRPELQTRTRGNQSEPPASGQSRAEDDGRIPTLRLFTAAQHLASERSRSARAPRDGSKSPDIRTKGSPCRDARARGSRSPSKSPKKYPSSPHSPRSLQLEDLMVCCPGRSDCTITTTPSCHCLV